ncbi:DUF1501 domain-containing protein [Solimonas marina]|uniref:DUF1501 domain-containing protein n=1 Tax=Solimonas marina TaxID=2714601 RepID=A0A969WBF1_9GAMM|nr:DUF1501 domain-containing protein [Solimonas marina]NKF22381.1 DUF1501 domain-containing protein [Solimonas marina]
MHRRHFLQAAALLPLSLTPLSQAMAAARDPGKPLRRLVLVELNGGNDGLNTVVPYADEQYYTLRPQLGIGRDQVLPLDERVGFNPALEPLMPLFKRGELAVVQGVGYAPANRSHFRSIEIWDTATDADVTSNDGWLGQLDAPEQFGRSFAANAVVIGRNPRPVSGPKMAPVVMSDAASFVAEAKGVQAVDDASATPALRHVLSVERNIVTAGRSIGADRPAAAGNFPRTPFGQDAAQAAGLLIGDPATPIVKIALTGFDTHVDQRGRQDALLAQFADTMVALRQAFVAAGIWDDVLIVTYSEFGRRARQNASGGTDHGKAAPHFIIGGKVRGGLYGEAPQLARLDDGDVPATTDFRRVYNTVLVNWWKARGMAIAPHEHPPLSLI